MRKLAAALISVCLLGSACAGRPVWGLAVQDVPREQLADIAPSGRLPGAAKPVAYRVRLDIDPRQTRFSGSVDIDVRLETAATGLWLHGEDLDIASVTATAGGETVVATWTEVLDTGVVWVGFPKRLSARAVTLSITYSAAFDRNLAGLFRVDAGGNAYALAKSESIQARRFLPSFDEPGMKAVFAMEITVPEGMHAIANTPEIGRERVRPGYETVRFAPTRPLSTFLLSTAVGNFDRLPRPPIPPSRVRDTPIPLTGYTRAGKGSELDYALSITPAMVLAFEDMFGQPYPYEKLDIIAAPDWPSGATELAAAITYREARILRGPNAGPAFIRGLKEIHAHEIAHMWFGNLVTPPWWDDLWLKEGFATWSEPVLLSALEPDAGHALTPVATGLSAMALDSLAGARAVAEPIERNADIRNAYDAITYSKGQAIIHMADQAFGPDTFRSALGRYLSDHADGAANNRDFFASISRETGERAAGEVFRSFVTQSGVPLVEAEITCPLGAPRLTLSQSRYRPLGSDIDPARTWTIPVCVAWRDGANDGETCTIIRGARTVVDIKGAICPDLLIPNARGAGYYRFNVSARRWAELTEAIAGLPDAEALTIIDSAQAAFVAGEMAAADLRSLLDAAAGHQGGAVIVSVMRTYESLIGQLEESTARDRLRASAAAALSNARENIAMDAEALARLTVFEANGLEDPVVRANLISQLDGLMAGTGSLSSDLYRAALRAAFQSADAARFDAILAARARLDDAPFSQAVYDTIGLVPSQELANKVRDLMINGSLGPQASYAMAFSLMSNPHTRDETWAALKADFPAFLAVIPSQQRRNTPRLVRTFCDPAIIPELETLFAAQGPDAAGHERALAETAESVRLCAALRQATRDDLERAF